MYLDQRLQQRLDDKLSRLKKHRPLSKNLVEKLREQFSVEMTYNSTAIEGNTMTLQETFLVLKEGFTIKGKTFNEHLEIKNHSEALKYLYEVVNSKKRISLSNKLIRDMHTLVVRTEDAAEPGSYRSTEVRISGSQHVPTPGYQVVSEMKNFVDKYTNSPDKELHPIEYAALFHHDLVSIHPFIDGNGRTARLLMNLSLMQEGYPLVALLKTDRKKYYSLLEKAHFGKVKGFVNFVGQAVERSLDLHLSAIETNTPDTVLIPLSQLAQQTTYSAEYLSLLARRGQLAAHKKGKIWYASLQAVEEYIQNRLRQR